MLLIIIIDKYGMNEEQADMVRWPIYILCVTFCLMRHFDKTGYRFVSLLVTLSSNLQSWEGDICALCGISGKEDNKLEATCMS